MTFQKGQSGNPGGKPHRADIKLLCRRGSKNAVRLLRQVVEGKLEASVSDRIRAAQYIIDRVEGKPEAAQSAAGGLFQGATIIVDTGIKRALEPPTIDAESAELEPVDKDKKDKD